MPFSLRDARVHHLGDRTLNGMENGLFVGIMCPISFPIITYCYIRGAVESDDTEEWSGKYDLDEKKIASGTPKASPRSDECS